MKPYRSIPGLKDGLKEFEGQHCFAFYKYDGSCLRFEWTPKRGWWKFGTRLRLFDESDKEYGRAIEIFKNTYAEGLEKVFKDNKNYRKIQQATVFCEFFGPNSFAGWHNFQEDTFKVQLFDVEIHKKGFVLPHDFIDQFGHLGIPPVIYEGPFDREFCKKVIDNQCETLLEEGVVVKGGPSVHKLWMSKIKTKWWLEELKRKAERFDFLKQTLVENQQEQL